MTVYRIGQEPRAGTMDNVVAELERRLEQAEDENDALELRLAKVEDALRGGEHIPAAIVDRLAEGEAPVRVWREYRGFSLRGLAEMAGISAAMLSEIEPERRKGAYALLPRSLARSASISTTLFPGTKTFGP